MSRQTITLTDALSHYLRSISQEEPSVLTRLREETADLPDADMQIAPEQGAFMGLVAAIMGAKQILEIGTFTGYSSLAMALASNAHVTAVDVSAEWTAIARDFWQKAGRAPKWHSCARSSR